MEEITQVRITKATMDAIGDSIRLMRSEETKYLPSEMPSAIEGIQPVLQEKTFSENGNYLPDLGYDGFSGVHVAVPAAQPNLQSKTATENGRVTADQGYDGLSEVIVDVSGGSSSQSTFGAAFFYGRPEGTTTSSLTVQVDGREGDTCVLVVMHRDAISLSREWSLIDSRSNQNNTQYCSIYKRALSAATEITTITQASSARMCASVFLFTNDIALEYYNTLTLNSSARAMVFNIPAMQKPCLICASYYTASSGIYQFQTAGKNANVIAGLDALNSSTALTARLVSLIIPPMGAATLTSTSNRTEESMITNNAFLYTIS